MRVYAIRVGRWSEGTGTNVPVDGRARGTRDAAAAGMTTVASGLRHRTWHGHEDVCRACGHGSSLHVRDAADAIPCVACDQVEEAGGPRWSPPCGGFASAEPMAAAPRRERPPRVR